MLIPARLARRAAAIILALITLSGAVAASQPAAAQSGERCFRETGYCISGPIRDYWERNGGLAVFGYPISEQRREVIEYSWTGPVQWFERDRLEDHANEGKGVLAGRLAGRLVPTRALPKKAREPRRLRRVVKRVSARYIKQTRSSYGILKPHEQVSEYMATHQKTYRYRALPTAAQEGLFWQYAGARRWVFNWALARRKEHHAATGKGLSVRELCAELTVLKRQPEMAWLREMNAQMLQQAIRDLDKAFEAFFAAAPASRASAPDGATGPRFASPKACGSRATRSSFQRSARSGWCCTVRLRAC